MTQNELLDVLTKIDNFARKADTILIRLDVEIDQGRGHAGTPLTNAEIIEDLRKVQKLLRTGAALAEAVADDI